MSEWIVNRRKKPYNGELVIAIGTFNGVRTSPGVVRYLGRAGWRSVDGAIKAKAKITHWMPLPIPPSGIGKEPPILRSPVSAVRR